jgi:hypothetical protein
LWRSELDVIHLKLSEEVASKNNKMLMSGNLLNVPLFTGAEKVKYKRKESSGARDSGSIFNCSLRLDLLQIFINTLLKNRTRRRDRIIYYLHSRPALKRVQRGLLPPSCNCGGGSKYLLSQDRVFGFVFRSMTKTEPSGAARGVQIFNL